MTSTKQSCVVVSRRTSTDTRDCVVALDNVNDDGTQEIWCSDATGYIYLFQRDASGVWECVYRSKEVGIYPGMYNNLFPIKNLAGKTIELVVCSPGYLMRFRVDHTKVEDV